MATHTPFSRLHLEKHEPALDPKDPTKKSPDRGDDIPDTPPTEPKPEPVRDPRPPGQPRGPYVAQVPGFGISAH